MDSEIATDFALSPRHFPGRWFGEYETIFRPSFPDTPMLTQLRQNTIGAYMLRNFVGTADILKGLKNDALEKILATKEVIDTELAKYKNAFDKRFNK